MASSTDVTPVKTWVAIDVAKFTNVALMEFPDGKRKQFRFRHCAEDYDQLVSSLRSGSAPTRIAFEPTGDYHRSLGYRLVSEGFDVVLVSSVAGARMREAIFNSWDKNDPKDAQVILQLMKQGMTLRYCDPLILKTHDLQELSKTYHSIAIARKRLQHVLLTHYLPLYFPEMETFWTSTRNEWFIRFLIEFPTPASITSMTFAEFREAVWVSMGRRVHKEDKIAEIYRLATHSIGLPVALNSPAIETYRLQLTRYLELCQHRRALESKADELLSQGADYQHLRSVPGVGPIVALVILAEAGDLRRFTHHRQFLKYCGLDLAKNQSGVSRSREQLSKRGNARLRGALWQAALSAVRMRENAFRDKFQRYTATAPLDPDLRRKARVAVTAKMARIIYALIKHGQPYRHYLDAFTPSGSIPNKWAVEAFRTS